MKTIDEFLSNVNIILSDVTSINEDTFVKFNGEAYPNSGIAVIMAGPPASGKSTIIKQQLLIDGKIIDPDRVSELMTEKILKKAQTADEKTKEELLKPFGGETPDLKNPEHVEILHFMFKKYKDVIRHEFLKDKSNNLPNIIVDTTAKDTKYLNTLIDEFYNVGYYIVLVFMIADLHKGLERNKQRSRTVKDDVIVDIYFKIYRNLPKMLENGELSKLGDVWVVFSSNNFDKKNYKERFKDTAFKLEKSGDKFIFSDDMKKKINDIVNNSYFADYN